MKKLLKKTRSKVDQLLDRSIRRSSYSASPAPPNPHLGQTTSVALPPGQISEHEPPPSPAVAIVSTAFLQPSQLLDTQAPTPSDVVPISPTAPPELQVFHSPAKADVQECITAARLASDTPLGPVQATFNINQNATYNQGRDVINNNSITNIYHTKKEAGVLKTIRSSIGDRFVPAALDDTQREEVGCLAGTRTRVLSMFLNWAKDDPMRLFWLAGLAGTGKTSIAVTLCRMLQEDPDVIFGGAFFCSRTANIAELTDARCILPTLSMNLAERSTVFAAALSTQLAVDSRAALKPISVQMVQLLQQPLNSLASSVRPIILLIDALDECSDENEVKKLLRAISTLACDAQVKFIVTSRPETHINTNLSLNSSHNTILQLHTIDKAEVTEDIRLYIDRTFSEQPLGESWYTACDVDSLASHADGLFIFASTVISYVLDTESVEDRIARLQTAEYAMKDSKVANGPLDTVYDLVLTRASDTAKVEPKELRATQQVLACILTARMPLSIVALAEMLGRKADVLRASLRRLRSVVHIPEDVNQAELRTVHTSFGDYLFERARDELRISAALGHEMLAKACLGVMGKQLHFNVSQMRSSHENNAILRPDTVTLSLEYSCLHWIYHLDALPQPWIMEKDINDMFCSKFLFWLEVMSVLGRIQRASAMLSFAATTVQSIELSRILRDANSFVASSCEAIERSAPHIYLSALPFAAKSSLIHKLFSSLTTGVVSVRTLGIERHGQRLTTTLTGHSHAVYSVTYTPDGRLVSGSKDGTVIIWDPRTGDELISLSCGSDDSVTCVVVAPSGTALAASTDRDTLCIWNLQALQKPPMRLSCHFGKIRFIAFSPDGWLIASATKDHSLCLWSVTTGQSTALLSGHTLSIVAVAFSLDGQLLASCSLDKTLRLWTNIPGQPAEMHILNRDTAAISLCFSPDGKRLAVCLFNAIIQLWDVMTKSNTETLRGHAMAISSVQFSPDGRSIVSASRDKTVRLWSVNNSIVLRGHSDSVTSATFSSDGLYIASASYDTTIRIWDASTEHQSALPLDAHLEGVMSLGASTDGALIASRCRFGTVRVWDVQTGILKSSPNTYSFIANAISQDASIAAAVLQVGGIQLWDLRNGDRLGEPLQQLWKRPNAMKFSSDARWIAILSSDGTVCIWDVATQQPLNIGPLSSRPMESDESTPDLLKREILSINFSPDGHLVAAGDWGGNIHIWYMNTGQRASKPLQETRDLQGEFCIVFSPGGLHIASSAADSVGHVWDVAASKQILALVGHIAAITSIAYLPSGTHIVTGSDDCSVRLWDVETGGQITVLYGHIDIVWSIVCMPSNQSIVTGSDDGTIRIWDVETALVQAQTEVEKPMVALERGGLHDGWVLGQAGELLLWVPEEYRAYLNPPSCQLLIAKHRVIVTIGDAWNHGENWTACWLGALPA